MTEVVDKQTRLRPLKRALRRKRLLELVFDKKAMDPKILDERRRQRIKDTLSLMSSTDSIDIKHRDRLGQSRYRLASTENGLPRLPLKTLKSGLEDCSQDRLSEEYTHSTDESFVYEKKRNKFCVAANCVRIVYRLIKSYKLRQSDRDMLDFFAGLDSGNWLEFDCKVRISEDTERILSSPASKRKPEELHKVQAELQSVRSVAEYPISMQHRIAKHGMYSTYDAERVIIRYGHRPKAFYFLLSGSAIVVDGDPEEVGRAVRVINKGDSYGDASIVNQTRRVCTVISRETVELLVISKEDFIDIFMSGGMKNFLDKKHSVFIKSLFIFKNWPLHVLNYNTKKCMFKYYKRGTVIEEDSNKSEWIYIIKSGTCSVLKTLTMKSDQNDSKHSSAESSSYSSPDHKRKPSNRDLFGSSGNSGHNRRISVASTKSSYMPQVPVHNSLESDIEEESEDEDGTSKTDSRGGEKSLSSVSFSQGPFLTHTLKLPQGSTAMTTAAEARRKRMAARSRIRNRRDSLQSVSFDMASVSSNQTSTSTTATKRSRKSSNGIHRRKRDTYFVKLDTLERGGVFGVLDAAFGEQPSLSLVSNGAECILISKKFYLKHASEENINIIQDKMRPYPSEDMLTKDLEEKIHWASYAKDRYRSAVQHRKPYKRTAVSL
ncbi:uncharacterized protein [Ptychodera flava]|uniref:uncharacterized protein n=1 Tax=Ptychodera flava TaxID=63121 RepID=UPI00396A0E72